MSSSGRIVLIGDHWASRSAGFLAVEIVTGLVLILCLFFVPRFKWILNNGRDTVRTFAFVLSTVMAVVYFILDLANLGLAEKNAVVSYQYFVVFIFMELFFRISELVILFVIARTVNLLAFRDFANRATHRGIRNTTFIFIGIVGVLSTVTWSLYAAYYGSRANGSYAYKIVPATIGFIVAYGAVYTITSVFILAIAIVAVRRQRSKASLLMLSVAMSLLLRALLYLVVETVQYYSATTSAQAQDNLDWAFNFIYDIMTMGIYLGITAVATIGSNHDSMSKNDQPIELAPFAQPHVYL